MESDGNGQEGVRDRQMGWERGGRNRNSEEEGERETEAGRGKGEPEKFRGKTERQRERDRKTCTQTVCIHFPGQFIAWSHCLGQSSPSLAMASPPHPPAASSPPASCLPT